MILCSVKTTIVNGYTILKSPVFFSQNSCKSGRWLHLSIFQFLAHFYHFDFELFCGKRYGRVSGLRWRPICLNQDPSKVCVGCLVQSEVTTFLGRLGVRHILSRYSVWREHNTRPLCFIHVSIVSWTRADGFQCKSRANRFSEFGSVLCQQHRLCQQRL